MKTPLHKNILRSALGLTFVVACSVIAQTTAPAPAGTGTAPTGGTRTETGNSARVNQPAQPQPGGTVQGTTTNQRTTTGVQGTQGQAPAQTTAPGTATTGISQQTAVGGTAGLPQGTVTSAGTISSFGATDFSIAGADGAPNRFIFTEGTTFLDANGNAIPRDRFFRRGDRVNATVFYTRSPDGSLMASRVMLNESVANAPIESAGTITEVSPGVLVIEQPGASATPVRYVNNQTTNYVNENGEPVPPESVKAGTPVKIFYTKVGDTLVASKVEVQRGGKAGLPKPPIKIETERTTTTTEKKEEK